MTRAGRLPSPALLLGGAVLANIAIAAGLGAQKGVALAVLLAALPAILLAAGGLVIAQRALLVYVALGLTLTGLDIAKTLPVSGLQIFPTDILVLLALGGALASRLLPRSTTDEPRPQFRTPVLGIPLVLLAATITLGAVKGHERYGVSLIGEPARVIIYAGIAAAMVGLKPERAWRAITVIFYTGAVVQSLWAAYYIATGTSQTESVALSTGGTRILALSSSIYLTGSLLCALLNLELNQNRVGRQVLDAVIGVLAMFGILVSFGRTTYVAVALIVPLLVVVRRQLRRSILWLLPLFAPVFILVVLLVPQASPKLVSDLSTRLTKTSSTDRNVIWRDRARAAAMEGVDKEIVTGVGFGRRSSFRIENEVVTIDGDPHNSYIWLLAGGGILALGTFLLVAAAYVVDTWRRIRFSVGVSQALVMWSLATWLAFMINALAGPIFTDATMLLTIWITMLLPAIVVRQPTVPEEDTPSASPEPQFESALVGTQ